MQPDSHRAAPSPDNEKPKVPLAQEISLACRELHGALNKAILAAFPHGLPPQAETPAAFARGVATFCGTPYLTFERAFDALKHLSQAEIEYLASDADDTGDSLHNVRSKRQHRAKVTGFLKALVPAGLERTPRLTRDLIWFGIDAHREPVAGTAEHAYKQHIISVTHKHPHLLTAYAWTMYMAVFAGGRQIRKELASYPDDFWNHGHAAPPPHAQAALDRPGYSFLSFDGSDDGAELYTKFRSAMDAADHVFTAKERGEIIKEAQEIFKYGIAVVQELDQGHSDVRNAPMHRGNGDAVITVNNLPAEDAPRISEKKPLYGVAGGDLVAQLEANERVAALQRDLERAVLVRRAYILHHTLARFMWLRATFVIFLAVYAWVLLCYYQGYTVW